MGGGASRNQQIPQPASQPQPPRDAEQDSQNKKEGKKGTKNGVKGKQEQNKQKVGSSIGDKDQNQNASLRKKLLQNFAPPCANHKKSTYVCLGQGCKSYAFYCLDCQFQCSQSHEHGKQCHTVSVKEFQKRIENKVRPSARLTEAIQSYKQSLTQMKESFHQFYLHQHEQIQNVQYKKKLPPENAKLEQKIEKGHKQGLNGKQMKQLWDDSATWKQEQQRLINLIKNRKEFLINLHECFNSINSIQDPPQEANPKQQNNPPQPKQTVLQTTNSSQQKAYHFFKRYQFDPKSLILSKQGIWSSSKKK